MSKQKHKKRKRDKREAARRKGLREAEARRKEQAEAKPQYRRAKTTNGQRIQQLLTQVGWNPADYKDYVAIAGNMLIDWVDSYNVTNNEGQPVREGSEVILLHKSKLHTVVPPGIADMFWNKALGRRVIKDGPGPPPARRVPYKPPPQRKKPPKPEPERDVKPENTEAS